MSKAKKQSCKRCGAPCWGGFVLCRAHVNEKMRGLMTTSGAQLANGSSEPLARKGSSRFQDRKGSSRS